VVAWFDGLPQNREEAFIRAAREKGIGVYPVSALFVGPRPRRKTVGLVMGYSALEIAQIERGCKLLAQAFDELD
jgi:GntR family transcriptional regulator/MocR family aminotransferase